MKRKKLFRIFLILGVILVILINPVPIVVSASEDTFSSIVSKLNIPTPLPKAPVPQINQPVIDTQKINKYMSVEAAFLGLTDNVSVFFKDLNSGNSFSILPDKSWIPASIIKSYVAIEAFHQRHEGIVNFNTVVTVTADNVVANPLETDEFPRLREGTQVTIGQLVQAMIIQSDNTAYNTLLDVLGRCNVESYIKSLGIKNTIVGEKLNVDDNQQRRDSTNLCYQYNVTTAGDYERLFDLVYSHKVPDSDELLAVFKRQKLDSMIPAMIPSDTPVAHKTGEWAPIYHDGGIVYKPESPFILALFSNSNSPSDLAKLAQIAYYQDASHVDTTISKVQTKPVVGNSTSSISDIRLADTGEVQNVLAASTVNTSAVTAADLGITANDLSVTSSDSHGISYTLITPASLLYPVKLFIENFRLNQASSQDKPALELQFAHERLRELKTISGVPNQAYINQVDNSFETNLKSAAMLSQSNANKDSLLLQAKELNDQHFVVLGATATKVNPNSKEKFIDAAYQSINKNEKEVAPIVKNSPLALVAKVEPVVGVIQSIQGSVATVNLDNGKTASVVLNDSAKVRSFGESNSQNLESLSTGDKIAVVGKAGTDGRITPVFILNNVPKVIPKTQGVILEIEPQANLIKIENNKGQIQNVQVDSSTSIQAKDTGVSLEGIKAGSVITVVGQGQVVTSPVPTSASTKSTTTNTVQMTIQAKTVVINVNGGGKGEVVKTKKPESKPAPKPASQPAVENKVEIKVSNTPTPAKK